MLNFGCQILDINGIPDSRFSYEGQQGFIKTAINMDPSWNGYPVVADATGLLSARGGCLAGTLDIVGSGIAWPQIDDGQWAKFFWDRWDPTSLFYSGSVSRGAERSGTGNTHKYKLNGAWDYLDRVDVDGPFFLGDDGGDLGSTGSIVAVGASGGALIYVFEQIALVTGTNVARDIIDMGSNMAYCPTTVKALTITDGDKLKDVIETLEFMATGDDATMATSDPGYWICGVDETRRPYFRRLSQATVALTVQHGNDHAYRPLVDWNEEVVTYIPPGRVRVWGGIVQSGSQSGLGANKIYNNARGEIGGGSPRLVKKPHALYAPNLDMSADMNLFQLGWFAKFGRKIHIVKSMQYVATDAPRPGTGFVKWWRVDNTGSPVAQYLFWDSAQFTLSKAPVIEMALGDEKDPRTSANQGRSPVRKMFRELSGWPDWMWPTLSREDTPTTPAGGGGGSSIVYLPPHGGKDFYDGGQQADGHGGR